MKLTVNNKTEYLNEYFFQTLILLYFQGEKFPKDNILEDKSATFELEELCVLSRLKQNCEVRE